MKIPRMIAILFIFYTVLLACSQSCSSPGNSSTTSYFYNELLIDSLSYPDYIPPTIDGVELGAGRSDGVMRLYTTIDKNNLSGYEYSFIDGEWSRINYCNTTAYCSSPLITDLINEGINSLYLGGWEGIGVLNMTYNSGWPEESTVLSGSTGHQSILAMKAGNGRNDGENRLYVAHSSDSGGLVEYSWTGSTYVSNQIMDKSVGRFAIGQGRNDGINRIYAVEREGLILHEFTWDSNSNAFIDEEIFEGSYASRGSVFVADGRGDNINRIYVWAGGLYELTYENNSWSSLTMDEGNLERYYIYAGSIRNDKKPSVYVSVKLNGLYEYTWSNSQSKYEVDAITSATGGCTIGDGRGDGKNRLYVASGSHKNFSETFEGEAFTKASIVEIWEEVDK